MADSALTLYEYSKSKIAEYCAVNTSDEEGADLYCALVEFLVGRYTRSDFAYGLCAQHYFRLSGQCRAQIQQHGRNERKHLYFSVIPLGQNDLYCGAFGQRRGKAVCLVRQQLSFGCDRPRPYAERPVDYSAKQVLDGWPASCRTSPSALR